jgi:F-type H+-transporting ATPase subunit b
MALHQGAYVEAAMASLCGAALLGGAEGGGFLEALPDPMRPTWQEVVFVLVLVTLLYHVLRTLFFKPITGLMDQRERDMEAGTRAKAEAAQLVDQRQGDYAARLKELRAKAFARRKELSEAVAKERTDILDEARTAAQAKRKSATDALDAERVQAKADLVAQVDALAESMAQHLLKGA